MVEELRGLEIQWLAKKCCSSSGSIVKHASGIDRNLTIEKCSRTSREDRAEVACIMLRACRASRCGASTTRTDHRFPLDDVDILGHIDS